MTGLPAQPSLYELVKMRAAAGVKKTQKKFVIRPRGFCLVAGSPRSGTTAMARWLIGQSGVSGLVESGTLIAMSTLLHEVKRHKRLAAHQDDLVAAARRYAFEHYGAQSLILGRRLFVDKQTLVPMAFPGMSYEEFLVNVRLLLPDSRLLLMVRDPLATVWSMKQQLWGTFWSDFELRDYTLEEHTENWCAGAEVALQYYGDERTYICQFGRLVHDPDSESERIFGFLGISKGKPFAPAATKPVGFGPEEREVILALARPQLDALKVRGLTQLC